MISFCSWDDLSFFGVKNATGLDWVGSLEVAQGDTRPDLQCSENLLRIELVIPNTFVNISILPNH